MAIFGGQTVVLVFEGGSTANFLAESGRFSKSKKGDSRASIFGCTFRSPNLLGGCFKYFLFSPLFGEDSHFDSYFSDGLKPPTRFHLMGCVKRCLL